jgi:MtN3 and saliva related transmembrane protein
MESWSVAALGIVAGLCTTGSFLPQVAKAWRTGDTGAISCRMYVIILAAFALWLVYGVLVGSVPMIVFNILNILLSGIILALKLKAGRAAPEGG